MQTRNKNIMHLSKSTQPLPRQSFHLNSLMVDCPGRLVTPSLVTTLKGEMTVLSDPVFVSGDLLQSCRFFRDFTFTS